MGAALLELSISDSGSECSALERLEQALAALRREVSELRCEVGYWKRMHADAVARNERLTAELVEARGEIRVVQDKLFGRKSEKFRSGDRSNDLFDPEQGSTKTKKRGAQPGQEDTIGVIILICRFEKSSFRCRKNRWPVRIAGSRPP